MLYVLEMKIAMCNADDLSSGQKHDCYSVGNVECRGCFMQIDTCVDTSIFMVHDNVS